MQIIEFARQIGMKGRAPLHVFANSAEDRAEETISVASPIG
jgi:hypothetical protein